MNTFNYLLHFVSPRKIEEKSLEENGIEILNTGEIEIYNDEKICVTPFGTFYKGEYKNEKAIIKVIDITQDEKILNEFILFKLYKEKDFVLKIKGVGLNSLEAYIVFQDYFQFTLEDLLMKKKLNFDQQLKITSQILNVLYFFQEKNEILLDFQPWNFGIDEKLNIKLLDFGNLVTKSKFQNEKELEEKTIKYSPPEFILNNKKDLSYDTYSFGCLLIDIFSEKKNKIINSKLDNQKYVEEIQKGNFPKIDSSMNKIIYGITKRCLNPNENERIKINELKKNLDILIQNFSRSNIINTNDNEIELDNDILENKDLKDNYKYAIEMDKKVLEINDFINGKLQENFFILKTDLLNVQDSSILSIDKNYKEINEGLKNFYESHKKYIEDFGSKILENFINLQNYSTELMDDLVLIQNNSMNIKLTSSTVNKFENKDFYFQFLDYFEDCKKEINEIIKKHTNEQDFDILPNLYNKTKLILENYKVYSEHISSSLKSLLNQFNDFYKQSEELKNELFQNLKIKEEIPENKIVEEKKKENKNLEDENIEEEEEIINNNYNYYMKPEENSNRILIYDFQTKTHFTQEIDYHFINKFYSLYNKETNTIYISGGIEEISNKDSQSNKFTKIKLKKIKNSNLFESEITELKPMNDYHYSHILHQLSVNKNIILSISGKETKSCEIYNIKENIWINIPELPIISPNSNCFDYNDSIYVICSYTFDAIYKLNMKEENENLNWEKINFIVEEGRFKRGMGLYFNNKGLIYLFGGFENEKIYDDVYSIDFNSQEIRVNLEKNMKLPIKSYFNSNSIYIKNEIDERIVFVDAMNSIIEYCPKTNFFYFYP